MSGTEDKVYSTHTTQYIKTVQDLISFLSILSITSPYQCSTFYFYRVSLYCFYLASLTYVSILSPSCLKIVESVAAAFLYITSIYPISPLPLSLPVTTIKLLCAINRAVRIQYIYVKGLLTFFSETVHTHFFFCKTSSENM